MSKFNREQFGNLKGADVKKLTEEMQKMEQNDYENLLIGGKHSRKEIDEARERLRQKKLKRMLGGF